jgi:ferric-dicitrate binding protein FerR (iron transport regulator)
MNERLHQLFARHLQRQLSDTERTELMGLLLEPMLQNEVQQLVHDAWETSDEEEELPLEKRALLFNQLLVAKDRAKVVPMQRKRLIRWLVAASILLLVMTGAYVAFFYKKDKPDMARVQPAVDIAAPTTSKARITLANGTTVLLDSLSSLNEGSVVIVKDKSGHVAYQGSANKEQQYNTLVNPRGSQVVNLLLADGTKVWLNAASSLTYFTGNTGTVREVTITGEGYFEVATLRLRSGQKAPFIVNSNGVRTEVLGTHFNVNAYDDEENMKVTLLEGKVKVSSMVNGEWSMLKPGEQVAVSKMSRLLQPIPVQTDSVIAWKNGWFSFNDADVPALMRQLTRWYDIEVEYEGNIPVQKFSGEINRSLTLNQVLKGVAKTGIRYKFVNDKKILILP